MSRLHGNAMVNDDGAVFQPATVEDALRIEAEHHARPAAPDRWPWPCPEAESFAVVAQTGVAALAARSAFYSPKVAYAQCRRVAGHSGEHRAEVTW